MHPRIFFATSCDRQVRQRMSHILRIHAAVAIKLLLERKDHQHLLHVLPHQLDAALSPGPQLWANKIDDGNAPAVQCAGQSEVEIRKIYEDGDLRLAPIDLAEQRLESAID